jgi:O-antigen/teichoic acid export membrane protein
VESSPEPLDPQPVEPDTIERNALFAFGGQFVGGLFAAVLTLFLVRALGPEDYGILALAVGVGVLFGLVSDLGLSASTGRFLAEQRGDLEAARGVIADAFRLKLVVGVAVSALLVAFSVPIANAYGTSELIWPLRLSAIAIFGQTMFALALTSFAALGRVSWSLRVTVTESSLETASSIGLVLLGLGAAGAAGGRAVGFAAAGAVGVLLMARVTGWRPFAGPRGTREGRARIARYAVALMMIEGAITLFNRIDVLLIGAYLGAASAGLFEAPFRVTILIQYVGTALAVGIGPRLGSGSEEPAVDALVGGLRLLIIFQGVFLAATLVWAHPISDVLLGKGYGESIPVIRALTPFIFLAGIAPLVSIAVNYLGEARLRVPLAVSAVAVNTVVDILLIPRIGIIAGAIGSTAAFLIYVPGHLVILRRLLSFELRPLFVTLARTMVAATAMGGVLFAIGTGDISVPAEVLGVVAGPLVYVAGLVITRELTRADLDWLRDQLAGRLRSRPAW